MLAAFKSRSRHHRRCVVVLEWIFVPERRRVHSLRGKIMTGEDGWLVTRWRKKWHIFWASGWAAVRNFFSLIPSSPGSPIPPTVALFKQRTKTPWVVFLFRSHTWLLALSSISSFHSKRSDGVSHGGFNKWIFWLILMALLTKSSTRIIYS